jgi:hypothetical protein
MTTTKQHYVPGAGIGVLDVAFGIVTDALEMATLTGIEAAGSVGAGLLNGIDNAVGALAEATTPPAATAAPAPDFAAMLKNCGPLNLGTDVSSQTGVSREAACDVNLGETGQLSVANSFGKKSESSPAMSA